MVPGSYFLFRDGRRIKIDHKRPIEKLIGQDRWVWYKKSAPEVFQHEDYTGRAGLCSEGGSISFMSHILTKLTIKDHFIPNFTWDSIPALSVITGVNGSGKTKLLEAIDITIKKQHENISVLFQVELEQKPSPDEHGYIPWQRNFSGLEGAYYADFQAELQNFISQAKINRIKIHNDKNLYDINEKIKKILNQETQTQSDAFYNSESFLNAFEKAWINVKDAILNEQIGRHILSYKKREEKLIVDAFHNNKISELVIENELGVTPWDLINQQFKKYNFKYHINSPKDSQSRYEVKFISNISPDIEIHFSRLSSGEQMIVMLILWAFNEELGQFKKLLLLDEPDAHLHPEMALMFKEIISEVVVKQFGVQVIMTTHSPTTLCWFEEESIFLMDPQKGIIKTNKQEAMNKLTSGLVFVHQNFKIIIVEDSDDCKFHQQIFDNLLLNNFLNKTDSLIFRSVNTKKEGGGKTKVIGIGTHWQELSANTEIEPLICGLVDRDKDNNQSFSNNIKVLTRYCFENYLADPLIIFALMVQEKEENIKKFSHKEIGYQHGEEYRFKKGEIQNTQKIVDYVLNQLMQLPDSKITQQSLKNKKTVEYTNGLSAELPEILLIESGKDVLLPLYRTAFHSKAPNINKNKLTDMMIKTNLIPLDLASIYKELVK